MAVQRSGVGIKSLGIVPIVVESVDDAIEFYTQSLGFELRTDGPFEMGEQQGRWVTVGIPGDTIELSLMTADEPYYDPDTRTMMESRRGTNSWYTFMTDDIEATVTALKRADVEITQDIQSYPWGSEAMFSDPCGNEFSVFQYAG